MLMEGILNWHKNTALQSLKLVLTQYKQLERSDIHWHVNQHDLNRPKFVVFNSNSSKSTSNPQLSALVNALNDLPVTGSSAKRLSLMLAQDISDSAVLEAKTKALSIGSASGSSRKLALRPSDLVSPGGRHDNDHFNFRAMRLLPTMDEMTCGAVPCLPLHDDTNRFIPQSGDDNDQEHYLDRLFRLCRHDHIPLLIEAANVQPTSRSRDAGDFGQNSRISSNVRIKELQSLCLAVEFDWPSDLVNITSVSARKERWERHFLLSVNASVCIRREKRALSVTTMGNIPETLKNGLQTDSVEGASAPIRKDNRPCTGLKIENMNDLQIALRKIQPRHVTTSTSLQSDMDMIILKSSFFRAVNVLKCLQKMDRVPLREYIVTGINSNRNMVNDSFPEHLSQGVVIPVTSSNGFWEANMRTTMNRSFREKIIEMTSLDDAQADASCHGLTNKVALMHWQGPPGTGKSFLGQLLVRKMLKSDKSVRILCFCYTNHALDQMLESLLDHGVESIMHIGGRSKLKRLEEYNIAHLAKGLDVRHDLCHFSRRRLAELRGECTSMESKMEEIQQDLSEACSWHRIEWYLSMINPDHNGQLKPPVPEDGFKCGSKNVRKLDYLFQKWIRGEKIPISMKAKITKIATESDRDLWRMNQVIQRRNILQGWVDDISSEKRLKLVRLFKKT